MKADLINWNCSGGSTLPHEKTLPQENNMKIITYSQRRARTTRGAFFLALALSVSAAWGQERWAFEPESDAFSSESLIDLRYLNEEVAGQAGWVKTTEAGDFALGDGAPVRSRSNCSFLPMRPTRTSPPS